MEAYARLAPLQGVHIPMMYGSTRFLEDYLHQMPDVVWTEVRGILIEFISSHVDRIEPPRFPYFGPRAVQRYNDIVSFGVLQGDPRLQNLLIRERDSTVFLIDSKKQRIGQEMEKEGILQERHQRQWISWK